MALRKHDIVEKIQAGHGFPRNQSVEITPFFLELTKAALGSGDDVLVSGFGKFHMKKKAEPKGRNPATNEDLMLTARRVVTFKRSGKLREKVNVK